MGNLFEKNGKYLLVTINILSIMLLIFFTEIILRVFLPSQTATMGIRYSRNGSLYGWGYDPGAVVKTSDPDTCDVWFSRVNNHGWRDLDREYENRKKAYRILILGDSNTYGAIVPAEKVYTRVLEEKLLDAGYNVEVLNMAYGGWGTDQELEALKNEGIRYKPNLIIVQWCSNDLTDNTYFVDAVNPNANDHQKELRGSKPFYYTIDEKNVITRHENPFFKTDLKEFIWSLVDHSEILKRLKELYLRYRGNYMPCDHKVTVYKIGAKQIEILQTVLGLVESSPLLRFLAENVGKSLTKAELNDHLSLFDQRIRLITLRVLEHRYFWSSWTKEDYELAAPEANSYKWRLYFGLIRKMKELADQINADLVIFPETEEGNYRWWLSWYWIKNDEVSRKNYFERINLIKRYMSKINVDVVDNTVPYQRARNDFHPNIEGNKSMAEDIFRFLMTHYKDKLEPYRIPPQ
ncbi:MAG: SGNH/GDSL hydrolase family protein [Desulfomonilaceae bacterium]